MGRKGSEGIGMLIRAVDERLLFFKKKSLLSKNNNTCGKDQKINLLGCLIV